MKVWYPQFDAYDSIRRMLLILQDMTDLEVGLERLFIADFYVCNPPLLHKTTMSSEDRNRFNGLKVTKPEKAFISFPAAPLLFRRMAAVQKEAVATLAGKSALNLDRFSRGYARLTESGISLASDISLLGGGANERELVAFVATTFSASSVSEITDLRRKVGLRRKMT